MYDTLRATLIQAEKILLRVLGFDMRLILPLEFLPRYLGRALEDAAEAGEDYDSCSKEEREEYGVLGSITETRIGRDCRETVI